MDSEAERRILAQIAAIKQEHAQQVGEQTGLASKLDTLAATIHDQYANGPGIGPRVIAMSNTDKSGPSWAWLNPLTWWENASKEGSDRAVRVFRQIVLLAFVGGILWYAKTVIDRLLDAREADARTPSTEVIVMPDTVRERDAGPEDALDR